MTKPIDELISAFLESAEELKKISVETTKRISDIENILSKQDLGDMKAGVLVTTDYCEKEHQVLENNVCGRADRLEVALSKQMKILESASVQQMKDFILSINRKIYASWLVMVLAFGAIGFVLKTHDNHLYEILKVVFK